MVAVLPTWLDYLIFGAIAFGIGYQFCKFRENPKAWLKDWFDWENAHEK